MPEIYLDNSATTKVRQEVVAAMVEAFQKNYGNPSSAHRRGQAAEQELKKARAAVAQVLAAGPEEICFTSGGTESNNLAIFGLARARVRQGRHLITTQAEHPSVLEAFRRLEREGFNVTYLPVDEEGMVVLHELERALSPETILVSTMHVNNEMGAVAPLEAIKAILDSAKPRPAWHIDAVQGFARLPLVPHRLGVDLVSLSGHKLQGPKGVGALFVRRGLRLEAQLVGGGQEAGLRSGTENVPGIIGLGVAARLMWAQHTEAMAHMGKLKSRLRERVQAEIPDTYANGPQDERGAAHILNLSFLGIRGEVLLHALEEKGVYVSTGSACSAHGASVSHVLEAMNLAPSRCEGALRFSFVPTNTEEEIDYTVECLKEIVPELRLYTRRR
ncbi:MAG: cysteine desulfurase family protein [bacterium]